MLRRGKPDGEISIIEMSTTDDTNEPAKAQGLPGARPDLGSRTTVGPSVANVEELEVPSSLALLRWLLCSEESGGDYIA
jgi:hypothetical protein